MMKGRITYRFVQPDATDADASRAADGRMWLPVSRPPGEEPSGSSNAAVIPLFPEDGSGDCGFGTGHAAREDEADRIERLILESGAGRGRLAADDFRDGDFGEARDEREPARPEHAVYRRVQHRPATRNAWLLLMSGLGAVLTGILLGSFVIQLFRGAPPPPLLPAAGEAGTEREAGFAGHGGTGRTNGWPDRADAGGEAGTEGEGTSPDGDAAPLPVFLPERTYYVVQHGVFSSPEGAAAAADLLRDSGYAGAVEDDGKLAVYAGMAPGRDEALVIARRLEAKRLDVYIKPVVLPALDAASGGWPGAGDALAHAAESRLLMDLVLDVTIECLKGPETGLPEDRWRELREAHRNWTERALAAEAGSAPESDVRAVNRAVASAMAALERYAKEPAEAYMWQVQTALLEHLIAQKQMAVSLSASAQPGSRTAEPAGISA